MVDGTASPDGPPSRYTDTDSPSCSRACSTVVAGGWPLRFALDWATQERYAGMQFNAVAASNHAAVELYDRLGFEIVGTVPGAFAHPTLGHVGLHVMYRAL